MRATKQLVEGLRANDARPIVEVTCDHEGWNKLNANVGCIHREHGPWPVPLADHHSGLRLVDGVPTRYMPRGKS